MTISIALATYNGAKFVDEQLRSFAEQERLPDQLVVRDDGSTDDTLARVEAFQAPFPVDVRRNPRNLGYRDNFAGALAACTGDLVFLSDQDDWWNRDKLSTMAGWFEADPRLHVAICDMTISDPHLVPSLRTQLGNIREMGRGDEVLVAGCATAVRRAFLDVVLPIPAVDILAHDGWIHALGRHLGVRKVGDRPLQLYRRHANNASNWVASGTERVRLRDRVRRSGMQDVSPGWRNEIARLRLVAERLSERAAVLERLGLTDAAERASRQIRERIALIERRLALVALPQVARAPRIARMWRDGDYAELDGWKSALNDLLRRRS